MIGVDRLFSRTDVSELLLQQSDSRLVIGWIEHGLTSLQTQYRLCGRRLLQVKRPNQQYQSTEGKSYTKDERKTQKNTTENTHIHTK